MKINKNAIRLKVGQSSPSSTTLNVDGNQLIKLEGTQTINTSGAQSLFNDSKLIDDYFLKGGYKVVSDVTCRNNIPCEYRKLGMQVVVIGPDSSFKRYILKGNDPCSNEGWEELINVANEVGVKLVEDYSVLESSLESQRDLNLYVRNNLIGLNQSVSDFDDTIKDVSSKVNYRVEIISTNGNFFKNDIIETTLIAKVYHGSEDITDSLPQNSFRWKRVSNDSTSDKSWNLLHQNFGSNILAISSIDVENRAVFNCEVNI